MRARDRGYEARVGLGVVARRRTSSFLLEGKSLCICSMQSATICSSEREKARSSKTACLGLGLGVGIRSGVGIGLGRALLLVQGVGL